MANFPNKGSNMQFVYKFCNLSENNSKEKETEEYIKIYKVKQKISLNLIELCVVPTSCGKPISTVLHTLKVTYDFIH
jgi:hypothetical protein